MKAQQKKELILSLIKDDLINTKLVNGLNEMGLNADCYYLNLGDSIFKLMGFKEGEETDKVFDRYLELSEEAISMDISNSYQQVTDLAVKIYIELEIINN